MNHRGIWGVVIAIVTLAGACSGGPTATQTPSASARPATARPATPAPTARPTPSAPPPAGSPAQGSGFLYDPTANPRADVEAAFAAATPSGKRLLLHYGPDRGPDCHTLAAHMEG